MPSIAQTTDFSIKELTLVLHTGELLDISQIFDELSLYDNVFSPCISGSILIVDSNDIGERLKFDGINITKIRIKIDKAAEEIEELQYYKECVIYNMTHKENLNLTSQRYILHFCSEEFIYSCQIKITQHFQAIYSEIVKRILTDYLVLSEKNPKNGKSWIGYIHPTAKEFYGDIPLSTPFDAINWVCKRSVTPEDRIPDYVFYQTHHRGYTFDSIKHLMEQEVIFELNFNPKNLDDDLMGEFLGVRDLKVVSQYNALKNIQNGSYAGTKVLFDTLTRTFQFESSMIEDDIHSTSVKKHHPNLPEGTTKNNEAYKNMYESRVVAYPYSYPRGHITEHGDQTKYFIDHKKNPEAAFFSSTGMDNVEEYIYKRKPIFTNLLQRRVQLLMPGNFALQSGHTVNLTVPKYSIKQDDETFDRTLTGKYLIIGTRHLISYTKHETIIQVAKDNIEYYNA
jgi:hypothetical protein